MQVFLLVVHILLAISLVGLILLQHGKGADAGAAFGSGASATVFGARGSASFLTRATAVLAILFFSNSFFLDYLSAGTVKPKSLMDAPQPSSKDGQATFKEGDMEVLDSQVKPVEEPEQAPKPPAAISDVPEAPGAPPAQAEKDSSPPGSAVSPGEGATTAPEAPKEQAEPKAEAESKGTDKPKPAITPSGASTEEAAQPKEHKTQARKTHERKPAKKPKPATEP